MYLSKKTPLSSYVMIQRLVSVAKSAKGGKNSRIKKKQIFLKKILRFMWLEKLWRPLRNH